jgi:hypothetical protein
VDVEIERMQNRASPCKLLFQHLSGEAVEIQEIASMDTLNREENWTRDLQNMEKECNPLTATFGPRVLSKKLELLINMLAFLIDVI